MMDLTELKGKRELIDAIDWEMGPEEAVRLYLEWGNNWSRGYRMIRSKDDASYYFVLNTWEDVPLIYFIKRATEGTVELARFEVPDHLKHNLKQSQPVRRGVYGLHDEVRDWLRHELDAA